MPLPGMLMARPKSKASDTDMPDGTVLQQNLIRLGYSETVVKTTEVAKLVTEKTGRNMSRQRIANLLNAVRIRPATIELLAAGLGVKPTELTRPPKR